MHPVPKPPNIFHNLKLYLWATVCPIWYLAFYFILCLNILQSISFYLNYYIQNGSTLSQYIPREEIYIWGKRNEIARICYIIHSNPYIPIFPVYDVFYSYITLVLLFTDNVLVRNPSLVMQQSHCILNWLNSCNLKDE